MNSEALKQALRDANLAIDQHELAIRKLKIKVASIQSQLNTECATSSSHANQREKLVQVDTHLRQLHKTLLHEYVERTSQLDSELSVGDTPLIDYEVEIRLNYLAAETDPSFNNDADPILASRAIFPSFDALPQALNQALQAIDMVDYADSGSSCPQCFLTHDVVSRSHGASAALGEAGLLRADRVWVDFVLTRQYCMELESGAFQKMPLESCGTR